MKNLVLIGLRGSGKSTVGRALAKQLGRLFVDIDEQIELEQHLTVAKLFETEGEPAFRVLESNVIERFAAGSGQVIAVGGGGVLVAANRDQLRAAGTCVWLTASDAELHRRVASDPRTASLRPALTDATALEEIGRLHQERAPLYAEVAHHCVDTTGRDVGQVVEAVLAVLD